MHSLFQFAIRFLVIVAVANAALAQEKRESDTPREAITAFASTERVRFTAPSSVVQMHLEVYSETALKLFDFELKGGNVLDWHLQNGQAERVAAGAYLCVITVKNLAGKITQKIGIVSIVDQQVTVESVQSAELKPQQAQAIGPLEADASLTVLKAGEAVNGIVLAHNGEEAQISRGQGPLTFRLGDFYSGKDSEQMRLTADGKLGLGLTDPQAKLDVAGMIRTSEGMVFPDGTVQTTAYVASGRSLSERVGLQRDAQGRSVIEQDKSGSAQHLLRLAPAATPDRLAKFAADGVTPVDTQVSESNGALVVGNAGATGNIQIFGQATADVFAGMGPDVNVGPAFNYGYAGSSFGRSAGFFNVRPDASAVAPNPSLRFLTANQQRMIITNLGNVGIGTTSPANRLDVNGGIRAFFDSSTGVVAQTSGGTNAWARFHMNTPSQRWFIGTSNNFNGNQFYLVDDITGESRLTIQPFGGAISFPLGNVGVGTTNPSAKLDVRGHLTLEAGTSPVLYTAASGEEQNRYLQLINSPSTPNASGLKAGGILVADSYGYANPGKNDLIVKGNVGIGGNATQSLDKGGFVKAMIYVTDSGNIARCYNSKYSDGGASLPGCGFSVTHNVNDDSVATTVTFDFPAGDRFWSATYAGSNTISFPPENENVGLETWSNGGNTIFVRMFLTDAREGLDVFRRFMLIVY